MSSFPAVIQVVAWSLSTVSMRTTRTWRSNCAAVGFVLTTYQPKSFRIFLKIKWLTVCCIDWCTQGNNVHKMCAISRLRLSLHLCFYLSIALSACNHRCLCLRSLSLCLCLCLSLALCLSLSVCIRHRISSCLYLYVSVYLLSVSLAVCLCLSVSLPLCLCLSRL